jgi:hypothetical protein
MRCSTRALLAFTIALAAPTIAHANGRFPAAQHLWAAHTTLGDSLVLRSTFGLLASDDGGTTFHYLCEEALGYADRGFLDPPVVLDHSGRIYVGSTSALQRVDATRCDAPAMSTFANDSIGDLDATPDGLTIVAAVTRTDGSSAIVRSDDGGEHFALLGNGLASVTLNTLEVARSDTRVVYASGYGADRLPRVYGSHDGGATLEVLPFPTDHIDDAWIAGIDPTDANTVFVRARLFASITSDGGASRPTALMRSRDGGMQWSEVTRTHGAMLGFAVDDTGRGLFVGSAAGDGLVRSLDGGETWATVATPHVQCLRWFAGALYVCGDWLNDGFAIARSPDQGTTLEPVLRFDQVHGAYACPASSIEGSVCASRWHDLERQFFAADASTTLDATADGDETRGDALPTGEAIDGAEAIDAGSHGAEPRRAAGCHCVVPRGGVPGFAVLAFAAALVARRKRSA